MIECWASITVNNNNTVEVNRQNEGIFMLGKSEQKTVFLCVFWTKTELISQKTFRSLLSWAALNATHVIMQMLPAASDNLRKVGSEINVTDYSK